NLPLSQASWDPSAPRQDLQDLGMNMPGPCNSHNAISAEHAHRTRLSGLFRPNSLACARDGDQLHDLPGAADAPASMLRQTESPCTVRRFVASATDRPR